MTTPTGAARPVFAAKMAANARDHRMRVAVIGCVMSGLAVAAAPISTVVERAGSARRALPTHVSSPLLMLIARGNVALATVLNAVNTALAPVLVPALFLLYTGVDLYAPVAPLIVELAVTVLVPTVAGVALRTWQPQRIELVGRAGPVGGSLNRLPPAGRRRRRPQR